MIKSLLQKIFFITGIEVQRRKSVASNYIKPIPLYNLMNRIKELGFRPKTILDVGVANGTEDLYQTFPEAHIILIEPLEEFLPDLVKITNDLSNSEYILAAATNSSGRISINVHPDIFGSSLYKEEEDSDVNGIEREVTAVTLNEVCSARGASGPYLIKIDTQGSELDVLKGAWNILEETEIIIIETSLFEFFKGGPQFYDVISFLKDIGFVVYDIFNLQYRLLDGAMSQADLVFVKENGMFRKEHCYATRDQRLQQNKTILNGLKTRKSLNYHS